MTLLKFCAFNCFFCLFFLSLPAKSNDQILNEETLFQAWREPVSLALSNIPVEQFQNDLPKVLRPHFTDKGLASILKARQESGVNDVLRTVLPICVLDTIVEDDRYKVDFLVKYRSQYERYSKPSIFLKLEDGQYKIDQIITHLAEAEDVKNCPAERMTKDEYIRLSVEYSRLIKEAKIIKQKMQEIKVKYPEYTEGLR